jgi:hypothetical protein
MEGQFSAKSHELSRRVKDARKLSTDMSKCAKMVFSVSDCLID